MSDVLLNDPQTWYCVQSNYHQETLAKKALLHEKFIVFYPVVLEQSRRTQKTLINALFPRYLFISFDILDLAWRRIHTTVGVSRLMGCDAETPLPLPRGYVEQLRAEAGPYEQFDNRPRRFEPGDTTQITGGLFHGASGLCVHSAKERVTILLDVLGGQRLVTLPPQQLVPRPRAVEIPHG